MADFTLTATVKPEVDTDELQDQLDSGNFSIGASGTGGSMETESLLKEQTEGITSLRNIFTGSLIPNLNFLRELPSIDKGTQDVEQAVFQLRSYNEDTAINTGAILDIMRKVFNVQDPFNIDFPWESIEERLGNIDENTEREREFGDDERGSATLIPSFGKLGTALFAALKGGLTLLGVYLANEARKWGDKVWGNFAQDAEQAIEDFISKFNFVDSNEAKLIGDVADGLGKIFGGIATLDFKQVASGVMDVGGEITSLISSHLPQFKNEVRGLIDPFAETFSGFGGKFATWIKSGLPQWAQNLLGIGGSTESGGSDSRQGTVNGRAPIFDRSPIGSGGLPQTEPEAQTGNTNPGGRDDARQNVNTNIQIQGQSREEVRREIDRALDQFDKEFQRSNRGVR